MRIVDAAKRYKSAVAELFKAQPGGGCLAEASPMKDQAVCDAFLELDSAGKELSAAIAEAEAFITKQADAFKGRGYTIDDVREQSRKALEPMKGELEKLFHGLAPADKQNDT